MITIEEMRSALRQRREAKTLGVYEAQGIKTRGNPNLEVVGNPKRVRFFTLNVCEPGATPKSGATPKARDSTTAEIVNGRVDKGVTQGVTQEAVDDPGCLCRVCKRLWCCEYRNG